VNNLPQGDLPAAFAVVYRQALMAYVTGETSEESLMQAYDLGRSAVDKNINILELIAMHQEVLREAVPTEGAASHLREYLTRGQEFLAEVMAPFEMMHRSFNETISQLQEINATLEQRVEKRTRDLRESESKTADLARLYRILSSINSTIVRRQDCGELFREACRIAVEDGGYQMAWISLEGEDEQSAANTCCRLTDDGSACQVTPIKTISNEVDEDLDKLYRDGEPVVRHRRRESIIAKAGAAVEYAAYALLPLQLEEKTVGVFAFFSRNPEDFNDAEMQLLVELAGDLSFALDHISKEKQLNYLAYHDALTGLFNRNFLMEHLPLQFRVATRADNMVALLIIDLLHFSGINNTYGRHVGDQLLKQVGRRLCDATGNQETVARVGAHGFAVSLAGLMNTDQVAHRLEQEVLNNFNEPFKIHDEEIHVRVRVGIALFPSDGTDPDALYKYGEMALKKAHSQGVTYLLYNPAMNDRIVQSVTMEAKLRNAIVRGRLVLSYQPKIFTADESIAGMEVLVRYDDPEEGLVFPGRFIPLMEGTDMIIEIGNWVIRHAVDDLLRWRQLQLDPPRIAVNVSPYQLRQPNFVRSLMQMVGDTEDHGLDIEITEGALMEDAEENVSKLRAIRESGFGIAIDDFGTGYSSLSYLSRLPVTALKIDRSFILDMTERSSSRAIVSTIINLAHSLNLEVIAEGVDREEHVKLLRGFGCDIIQGNIYSLPLSKEEMTALLRRRKREGGVFHWS